MHIIQPDLTINNESMKEYNKYAPGQNYVPLNYCLHYHSPPPGPTTEVNT